MDAPTGTSQIDVNRGLRERLGHRWAGQTSDRQAAELELAVNDLQDLARSRFSAQPDDLRHR